MDVVELTKSLLSLIKKDREREVLIKRFSLDGASRRTLEDIGKPYGITRERVRQIEKATFTKLKDESRLLEPFDQIVKQVLGELGGLASSKELLIKLLGSGASEITKNSLIFLLHLTNAVRIVNDSPKFKEAWRNSDIGEAEIIRVSDAAAQTLTEAGQVLSASEIAAKLSESVAESRLTAILGITKSIIKTEEGKFGLTSWREINPKSIRDKTYFVVKKAGKPMHFREIADAIRTLGFDSRPVTVQAVHNELIRDKRFVLIGRGLYALSEWGYKPGTVADVIKTVLASAGRPLHKNEIIREVLKSRKVKEATIVLNLQNKNLFKRVAKATYTLV